MADARWRSVPVALLAAGAVAVPVVPAALRALPVALTGNAGFIMGGTGNPGPTDEYLTQIENLYLPATAHFDGQQTFAGYTFDKLATPEQFCPIVCSADQPNLDFGASVQDGAGKMIEAIDGAFNPAGGDAAIDVTVFGYSQSGTVAAAALQELLAHAGQSGYPSAEQLHNLHLVTIGDPNNPVSGMLARYQFPDGVGQGLESQPQHLPFLNVPLSIPPTDTTEIGPSVSYIGEYDGWSSMPQDQLNLLAMVNAIVGIGTVHPYYPDYSEDQLGSAVDIGTIGNTTFYAIPENLPILQFLYNGGTAGQFFGDLLSPALRLIIDWGYGNAGDPAVNGLYQISDAVGSDGANIAGSPFQAAFGVAGGPWAQTPTGELYGAAGTLPAGMDPAEAAVAGLVEKMDPLQMLAGAQYALIQTLIGPWVDVAAAVGGPLDAGDIATIDQVIDVLQILTGYDLVNQLDQALLTGWTGLTDSADLTDLLGPDALLTGALIPGGGIIDLVGFGFDVFNVFGA